MPYVGQYDGGMVSPHQVSDDASVICTKCGDKMSVVQRHTRDGALVSRHFRHITDTDCGGESDEHKRCKAIAASRLSYLFGEEIQTVQTEAKIKNTYTDKDHRRADAVATFEQTHPRFGDGIVIEVQHENTNKNKTRTQTDYAYNDLSTVWVSSDEFSEHDLPLSEADLRERSVTAAKIKREWINPADTGHRNSQRGTISDHDRQTRYKCWQCDTERWLPERPDDPSWRARAICERCNRPMGHHPVGSPHPAQLGEVVLNE